MPNCTTCNANLKFSQMGSGVPAKAIDKPVLPGVPGNMNPIAPVSLNQCKNFYCGTCYQKAYNALSSEYVDLDKPLNDCAYFVREGSTYKGHYVRDGKTSPMLLAQWWNDYDIFHQSPDFAAWYDSQGWDRNYWWIRRAQKQKI